MSRTYRDYGFVQFEKDWRQLRVDIKHNGRREGKLTGYLGEDIRSPNAKKLFKKKRAKRERKS